MFIGQITQMRFCGYIHQGRNLKTGGATNTGVLRYRRGEAEYEETDALDERIATGLRHIEEEMRKEMK